MMVEVVASAEEPPPIDPSSFARAMLNILEDFGEERIRLEQSQRALLNILEDFRNEEGHLAAVQNAILNILDDSGGERIHLERTQKAVLNILEDFGAEKERLAEVQKAMLNLLDDFDSEKNKVAEINRHLAREVAERMAVNKELEAFAHSVSHDLRAPLRAVEGFSRALQEDFGGKLGAQADDDINRIRAACVRMGLLIDGLLKLSRVTRVELRIESVDLSEMVSRIARDLRHQEPQRAVDVVIVGGIAVRADQQLLEVVIENLMGNAFKFTGGRAEARIEFGTLQQDGRVVYFVRDNGAGFDMAYSGKLFGAFQRLHSTTEFPGTGIGLATVQRIIHRHGGTVWAEGVVGDGATFFFTL